MNGLGAGPQGGGGLQRRGAEGIGDIRQIDGIGRAIAAIARDGERRVACFGAADISIAL